MASLGALPVVAARPDKTDNHEGPASRCSHPDMRRAAYKDRSWRWGWSSGRGSWVALIGWDTEGWSAGLTSDALLKLPENGNETMFTDTCHVKMRRSNRRVRSAELLSSFEHVLEQFVALRFASKDDVAAFVLELQEDFCQVVVKLKETIKTHIKMRP